MRTKKYGKTRNIRIKPRRVNTRRVNTRRVKTRNKQIKTIKYKGGNDKMSEYIDDKHNEAEQKRKKEKLDKHEILKNLSDETVVLQTLLGGKVLDSGGFGCVFKPSLKCKGQNRIPGYISKLMTIDNTDNEFIEIYKYIPILKKIPNYKNYFVIDNISMCDPDALTKEDLEDFDKCNALKSSNITPQNINKQLHNFAMLNEPDGGLELDEYIKLYFTNYNQMIALNNSLINLLKYGIIPMNNLKIYHLDIKGSNILADNTNPKNILTRLIDWGLSEQLTTYKEALYKLSLHPYQFNLPYSIIIFYHTFNTSYKQFISIKIRSYTEIYSFVLNYLVNLEKSPKGGHLRGTIKDLKLIFKIQNPMSIIIKYITDILMKYTKNNKLNIHEYLPIFLHNVDIWGFVISYESIINIINTNKYLNNTEYQLINCFKKIFMFLFQHNLTLINVPKLISLLQELNPLFRQDLTERKTFNLFVSNTTIQNDKSKLTNELKVVA